MNEYPKTKSEAARILDMVRAGFGEQFSLRLVRFCLFLTGDLV